MGDDIGSSSVTDCLLRLFSTLNVHTQQCRAALQQKSKQTEPKTNALLRPYYTAKRTREILISNIHLLSPQN